MQDTDQRERDERFTEVIKTFYDSKVCFDEVRQRYIDDGYINFSTMNNFVEECFFDLKEDAHLLFRMGDPQADNGIRSEDLFDVLIGSIFHELMKLKECVYQVEQYGPTYQEMEQALGAVDIPEYEEDFFKACKKIITRAEKSIKTTMPTITELYRDTCDHLNRVIPRFRNNRVLVRMLVEEADLIERAVGEGEADKLLAAAFDGKLDEAYLAAAREYLEGGWYERARATIEKAGSINSENPETAHLLKKLDQESADHRV